MRDLRYIIKRILIGVGIVLVLGFINSAKASALEITGYTGLVDKSAVTSSSVNRFLLKKYSILFYQDTYSGDIIICNNDTKCQIIYVSQIPFDYNKIGIATWNTNSSSSATHTHFIFLTKDSDLPYINGNTSFSSMTTRSNTLLIQKSTSWSTMSTSARVFTFGSNENFTFPGLSSLSFSNYYFDSNTAWVYNCYNNVCKNSNSDIVIESISSAPTIESLQPTKITTNNIVTGYIFRPKFSSFDTELYDFQYKVGRNSTTWLGISQNEQQIRINNNTDFYVRIKEKSSGDIIDSRSMTLTNIGRQDSNVDYDIKFTGEYRTANDLNNNQSSMNSIIMEYQISIDYIPKNSILKYQYQFITSGTCNDNNNWQDVSDSDNGTRTYVTNVNGTLCARILDPTDSDTQKKEATFVVNSIGKLAIDDNSNGVGGLFSDIASGINFGGPLSDIISIPINLINTISTGLAGGLTCNDYPLGSLFGTNLVIPCVNVKQHIGNSLYTTIDLIIACCMIYYIIKMFGELYTNLLFMSKNPIHDLGKRGD